MIPKNIKVDRSNEASAWDSWIMSSPGEGKTTFASTFPSPLMFNTDGNYRQFDTPTVFIPSDIVTLEDGRQVHAFDYFEMCFNEALADTTEGYETIVIDLLEDIVKMLEKKIAREAGKELIQDIPWGRGTKMVAEKMKALITKAHDSNKHIVYLSHSIDKPTINAQGQEIVQIIPKDMKMELIQMISGRVDLMANLQTFEIKRKNADGTQVLNDQGLPVSDKAKLLIYEKSDRLPSVVKRFKGIADYSIASYNDLKNEIDAK